MTSYEIREKKKRWTECNHCKTVYKGTAPTTQETMQYTGLEIKIFNSYDLCSTCEGYNVINRNKRNF